MIMVTHNPDLECYADRVLYVADGKVRASAASRHCLPRADTPRGAQFESQALNEEQTRLELDTYLSYLNTADQAAADAMLASHAKHDPEHKLAEAQDGTASHAQVTPQTGESAAAPAPSEAGSPKRGD